MSKKAIKRAGVLMLVMALLAGCSPAKEETTPASAPAAETETTAEAEPAQTLEPATVDILQFKVEISDALQAAAQTYMDSHENVKVNVETSSDYQSDLRAKMAGSDQPEIFCIDGPEHIKNWGDQLENLADQPWVEMVNPGLLGAVTNDQGVFGLPLTIEGYGFIYNKAIFEAAGIDLKSAKTYAEIDAAFAALQAKIDAGELAEEFPVLEAVTEFPAGEKWVGGLHTANMVLSCEFNGAMEAFNAEGIEFKYADALKDLIDLQVKYSPSADDPSQLNAVDYATQVGGGLLIERVAVIQQGNWISAEVMNMDPAFLEKLDMIGMPVNGAADGMLPVGVPTNWAVNAKSSDADKAAAKDFLNWLYTSEEGKDIIVNKLSFIPIMSGYEAYTVQDPLGKAIQTYSAEGNTIGWITAAFPAGWSDGVMGTGIQNYLAGQGNWDDIVADAKVQWSELKKK